MNWPFRNAKDELIETQRAMIEMLARQNEELKALFNMKSNFEVVDQTEQGVTLKMKETKAGAMGVAGRGGFRSRLVAGEAKTVPVPSDSVQALEQRVAAAKLHQQIQSRLAD